VAQLSPPARQRAIACLVDMLEGAALPARGRTEAVGRAVEQCWPAGGLHRRRAEERRPQDEARVENLAKLVHGAREFAVTQAETRNA